MPTARQRAIGARLKRLRLEHNLTQAQAAERIGLKDYRQWQGWEAGEHAPRDDRLAQIADEFGLSLADFNALGDSEPSQLDRIEAKLDELLSRLPALDPEMERAEAEAEEEERADQSERSDDEPGEETPDQQRPGQ
jgi:transcriptional regulator with XRE-family HTH domain